MDLLSQYEQKLRPARSRFDALPAVRTLLSSSTAPQLMGAFLVHFSALGVGMTEPVESWIRRAGERCIEVGLTDLGRALVAHARAEAGHDQLMVDDTRALVSRWNAQFTPKLDAEELLALPPTPSVLRYRELHEDVITGPDPYAQIAIEFEIEMLSTTVGPDLLDNCVRLLGEDILEDLTFITEHVELDVGHTAFNRRQLGGLLEEHPDFLPALVDAGSRALDAYGGFLADCVELGKGILRRAA